MQPTVLHDRDLLPLWVERCVDGGCHAVDGPSPVVLEGEGVHDRLVDQASMEAPLMDLVEPGRPEESYLVHKLRGTQLEVGGMGQQMPFSGPLSEDELALVEAWIAAGAHL